MRKKLRSGSGLTLVEMLCAVIILILLGLLLNTGLQMAVHSYHALTAEAETQLLASTLADALADDLRYARKVSAVQETVDGETVNKLAAYDSGAYGAAASITLDSEGRVLAGGLKVLPAGAYGNGAYQVERLSITCADDCFTIKIKIKEAAGDIFAEADVTVRCLNGIEIPGGGTP